MKKVFKFNFYIDSNDVDVIRIKAQNISEALHIFNITFGVILSREIIEVVRLDTM